MGFVVNQPTAVAVARRWGYPHPQAVCRGYWTPLWRTRRSFRVGIRIYNVPVRRLICCPIVSGRASATPG